MKKAADIRTAGAAISRMPRKIRDEVSAALEDGADWRKVAAICGSKGFPGVRPQNVTNYRKGAHQDWLRREARIEAIRRDTETTAAVLEHYVQNGGSPAESGLLTAAEMMNRALGTMGPETLACLIADDPKAFFAMTRELSRVADMLATKRRDIVGETPAESAPTLTPEQRSAAMKEIFGLPA